MESVHSLPENDPALVAARRQMKSEYLKALCDSAQALQGSSLPHAKILIYGSTCLRMLEQNGADLPYCGIKSSDVDLTLIGTVHEIEDSISPLRNILQHAASASGLKLETRYGSVLKHHILLQDYTREDLQKLGVHAQEGIQANLSIEPKIPDENHGYFTSFKGSLPFTPCTENAGLVVSHPEELLAGKITRQMMESDNLNYRKAVDILDIYRLLVGKDKTGKHLINPHTLSEETRLIVLLHFATYGRGSPTQYKDPLALFHNTPENRIKFLEAIKPHITAEGFARVEKDVKNIFAVCEKGLGDIFAVKGESHYGKLNLTNRELAFFNAIFPNRNQPNTSVRGRFRSKQPIRTQEPSLNITTLLEEYPKVFAADHQLADNIRQDPQLAYIIQSEKVRIHRDEHSTKGWKGVRD